MKQATDLRKELYEASNHLVLEKDGEIIDFAATTPAERRDFLNDAEEFEKKFNEV